MKNGIKLKQDCRWPLFLFVFGYVLSCWVTRWVWPQLRSGWPADDNPKQLSYIPSSHVVNWSPFPLLPLVPVINTWCESRWHNIRITSVDVSKWWYQLDCCQCDWKYISEHLSAWRDQILHAWFKNNLNEELHTWRLIPRLTPYNIYEHQRHSLEGDHDSLCVNANWDVIRILQWRSQNSYCDKIEEELWNMEIPLLYQDNRGSFMLFPCLWHRVQSLRTTLQCLINEFSNRQSK